MATKSSSRSQSPAIQVQPAEADMDFSGTHDRGHSEAECALSEATRFESSRAYLMDFHRKGSLRRILLGPMDLKSELRHRPKENNLHATYIVVIHGLPVDYVELLRDSSLLEACVVDSISRRRLARYPKQWNTWNQALSYEYPEHLVYKKHNVSRSSPDLNLRGGTPSLDLLDDPPRYSISEPGREVAICRATLRVDSEAHVLFLDRCLWRNSSCFRKDTEKHFVTKPCACDQRTTHDWDVDMTTHSEEQASLEQKIWEYLKPGSRAISSKSRCHDPNHSPLLTCFAQCVYSSWTEFLDTLTLQGDVRIYLGLLHQIQRSLERNIDAETSLQWPEYLEPNSKFSGPDWRELIERLDRRARLAVQLNPTTAIRMPAPAVQTSTAASQPAAEEGDGKRREEPSNPEAEENQRSLDRVTYLGGVLLPMTIVSGILAMGDTFGPTGDKFYVFWAAAVPLTLVTLVIIYADSIRRIEVWTEEPQQSTSESGEPTPPPVASGRLLGKKKPLKQQQQQQQQEGATAPDLEQAVPYSETITVDYGPASAAATTRINEPVMYMTSEPPFIVAQTEQSGGGGKEQRVWKKEELGWLGACKTILGIYKLQDLKKRPQAVHTKRATMRTTTLV